MFKTEKNFTNHNIMKCIVLFCIRGEDLSRLTIESNVYVYEKRAHVLHSSDSEVMAPNTKRLVNNSFKSQQTRRSNKLINFIKNECFSLRIIFDPKLSFNVMIVLFVFEILLNLFIINKINCKSILNAMFYK
jgi:hypothetical protein